LRSALFSTQAVCPADAYFPGIHLTEDGGIEPHAYQSALVFETSSGANRSSSRN